jgi:hypothetical protein
LAWDRVANALLPLNIASRFNLLAIFSACFGAHFLSQMDTIGPAPCWCLIAPTKKVDPGEILGGFRVFYSALFKDADMGSAVRAISRCQLSHGEWLWEPAEIWYQRIVTGYIKVHCTESAARERARTIYKDAKKDGKRTSLGSILRIMKKKNRDAFTGDYFDRFFIIDIIPENNIRFAKTKERVANTLATLRNIGKYAI